LWSAPFSHPRATLTVFPSRAEKGLGSDVTCEFRGGRMAYHESHERLCPTCGARISATAPKCYNCGDEVRDDDEEEEEEEEEEPSASDPRFTVILIGLGVLVAGGVLFLLLK
jgi:hypothetical protein